MKQGKSSRKVIVLKISQDVIGILVDNINDIIELTDDNFENIPALIQNENSDRVYRKNRTSKGSYNQNFEYQANN